MQSLFLTTCGLGFIGLIVQFRAAYFAPEAEEDDNGFHLLQPTDRERYAYSPSNVLLGEGDALFFR